MTSGNTASLFREFLEMSKPRIVSMVLVTTTIGFFLGGYGFHNGLVFVATLLGTALGAAGSAVLNNYIERESDRNMGRTRNRALPSGRVDSTVALSVGVTMVLWGVTLLACFVNLLSAFLVLLTAFLYVLVYTPLKRVSWWNTPIGAIPGALPPMIGWAAAAGELDAGAWILFAILFAWQHPHFYAIAWMYRADYREGGLQMLSVVDPSGRRVIRQSILFSVGLLGVSLLLTHMKVTGDIYLVGAIVLGLSMLAACLMFAKSLTHLAARRVLLTSVVYLPVLLLLIVVDASIP